jgi:murein DD-endopeptidase MepM/ murein hydrolase activator NlpD
VINKISTTQIYIANKEKTSAIGGPYSKKISNLKLNLQSPNEINIQNIDSEIQKLISLEKLIADMPFGPPVKRNEYLITSYFGSRSDPFHHQPAMHAGLDIQHPKKNGKIIATASGVVTFAGKGIAYGNYVDIKHNSKQEINTVATRYAHLSKIFVKNGEFVQKGQPIGMEGVTGRASGRHVHYEVRINNTPVNPLYLVENKKI